MSSPLSIRMEGAFEEFLAFGQRYADARQRFVAVTLDDLPIVRSRLDAIASEDAAFHRLLASYERVAAIASESERRRVAATREARELLLVGMRWLANDASSDLPATWAEDGDRL